jgi:hypothetical protein
MIEFCTKININTLEITILLFVYSSYETFIASFLHIKSPKYIILF